MSSSIEAKQALVNQARPIAEHVPVTSHITRHNVRLKGGEMATVFKIAGIAHEAADDEDLQGWHEALKGLLKNIGADDVAIWTHLLREPRNRYPDGYFDIGFASDLNDKYKASLQGLAMMVNSHYLTLIVRGKHGAAKWFDFGGKKTQQSIQDDIDAQSEHLDELADTVKAGLARYGARRLETYEYNGLVCSEVLEFYHYLLTCTWQRVAIPKGSARFAIGNARISFGVDQFEVRDMTSTRLGAIAAVSEYQVERTEPGHLVVALTIPFPFVLTQSFATYSKTKALAALDKQQRLLRNAKDKSSSQMESISDALDDLSASRSIYGEHHLSLMVLADTQRQLKERLAEARTMLSEAGFLAVREDECLEAAYFAQLPGNFDLRPRPAAISSGNFIGFTGFHNYPHGRTHGNQWGPALTLLKTTSGTPFYFNFHLPPGGRKGLDESKQDDRVAGHTLMLGPTGAGKTVIQTFMLAQAEKYKPTVFTFDKDRGQEIFIRAMGGQYHTLQNGKQTGFNPLALPDTPGNRQWVMDLVKRCIKGSDRDFRFSADREHEVQEAVNGVYRMPYATRRFSAIKEFFDPTDPNGNAARFSKWCAGGSLGWLLDNPTDAISLGTGRHFGFDVTDFLENEETRTVTVMYLFHRMESLIDGRRFILNMDEFWKMLMDEYFEQKALDAVKTYRKRNALALFGTQSPADVLKSRINAQLIEQCVTQLYLPNAKARREDYITGFKLSEREYEIVRKDMVEQNLRGFLFKQGPNAAVCELNLRGFDDELAVMSGTAASVEWCERARASAGETPDDWLPVFQAIRREQT
ncbi:VirB4 family type IV secretion/conjugal transfer ATPase [Dyella sp. M7H15-1]|uniref:VirB4 family type IV secretion/conjugal transfer ATPase n=1 Tax=Dyella sp. M7H15-1 TaxID=2501295 RepID=UPI0010051057|nr:VirB4 family type IV secretion/conjugal transfer ATPase [Dyella sp. M7H15-1]QAU23381.1 VirB4 family type IV secretion/conjugal transfer ATPase [Dyella sp. M7H15-1]